MSFVLLFPCVLRQQAVHELQFVLHDLEGQTQRTLNCIFMIGSTAIYSL